MTAVPPDATPVGLPGPVYLPPPVPRGGIRYDTPTTRALALLNAGADVTREDVLDSLGYEPPEIHWRAPGTSYRRRGAEHTIQDVCGQAVYSWKDPDEIHWRAPLHD